MLKRISAVGVSCVTALVLVLSAITSSSNVSAVSLEEMTNVAIQCIISHEGSYGSINPNDCGAVSVGKLQWHADRALTVMRRACENDPTFAAATLGSAFYNEVMSASSWNYRTFSSSEASAAAALLSSDCGVAAQDEQAASDVQNYIISGQNMGITDAGALVLYADIYNFGCGIAAGVAKRAASNAGSYSAVTLDDMHNAALNSGYSSNSAFVSRANMVYNYLCQQGFGGTSDPDDTSTTTTPVDQFTEDCAGTYIVTGSSLNMRSGPGTNYSIVMTIKGGESVTVTSSNGEWAAVNYGSYEGYCSMNYLERSQDTEPAETTTTTEEITTVTETTTETTMTSETEEITSGSEAETTEITTEITNYDETTTETTTVTESTTEVSESTDSKYEVDDENVIVNSAYASIYGDTNMDGEVTVADAVLLHKYLSGIVFMNVEQIANSDCSFDGTLSVKDVTVIMEYLSGHLAALPIL